MFSTILKFSVPVHCEVLPSLGDDELLFLAGILPVMCRTAFEWPLGGETRRESLDFEQKQTAVKCCSKLKRLSVCRVKTTFSQLPQLTQTPTCLLIHRREKRAADTSRYQSQKQNAGLEHPPHVLFPPQQRIHLYSLFCAAARTFDNDQLVPSSPSATAKHVMNGAG